MNSQSLTVDTNILIAAILKNSKTREIILDSPYKFFLPRTALQELEVHRDMLLVKSGFSQEEFAQILTIFLRKMDIIPSSSFAVYVLQADTIVKFIDPDDFFLIACALATNSNVWSEDKALKKQTVVKVYTTAELSSRLHP